MTKKNDQLIFNYNESLKVSTDYFQGDELAAKVFLDKYALKDNNQCLLEDNPEKMHWRIAKEFARIEKNKFKNPLTEQEIFNYLDKFKYIVPQGSQMFGIGNTYQVISLSNCYVVESPEDSYGGILKTDQQLVQISKRRGGVGVDLSKLRPAGSPTKNAAASSTGIESWMERYSNSIREVAQNGRRGALMETIDVKHPDIEKFISIKNDPSKVTGANISVKLSDEFLNAVDKDLDFDLQWPVNSKKPSVKKIVKAKHIWDKIIDSAWLRAEPGLLFWSNIVNNNAIDCYSDFGFKTESTNPCVTGDTLVSTEIGDLSILEIIVKINNQEEVRVFSYNEISKTLELKNVTNAFKTKKDAEILEIEGENGEIIKCTPDHKLFVENRGWIQAKDLTENDILLKIS